MKTKIINSQISNWSTYRMYFRQMLSLAENVFEFKNLPENIDLSYLNKTLVREGAIAWFKDEILGVIALPYTSVMSKDIYGRPLKIQVNGYNGYNRILSNTSKEQEFVIMYDNNSRYPIYLDICQIAERIALCVRTEDVNIKQQRTPRFWKVPREKQLSIKQGIEDIDAFSDNLATYESTSLDDLTAVLAPAPYVSDKIDQHLDKLWAEFFRLIGVANLQEQKKERVIQDEMIVSQGGTIASRFSRFNPRKNAIDKINKLFGENIEVGYYDGMPTTEKEGVDNDVSTILSNDAVSANDSESV